jgi:transketolase
MKKINISKQLRIKLLNLYYEASCGHIGSSLSVIDSLYSVFNFKKDFEKVILSKGHAAGALYIILNYFNEIPDAELKTFYKDGTKLSAHPSANSYPNIPFALGSLGHGLPIGCGIALFDKLSNNLDKYTYVIMSDGETNEGTTWESAHFAVSNKLGNLIVLIDKNKLQGFGRTMDILGDTSNKKIWNQIGFESFEIDGHNIRKINNTLKKIKLLQSSKPKIIILNTIKGKGVNYMEDKLEWHYLPMNKEYFETAIEQINLNYI